MKRRTPTLLVTPLLALLLAATAAFAQQEQEEQQEEQKDEKYKEFAELVEDAERHEGFLDLYMKDDKLYLAVEPRQLGQEFLGEMKIARGIGAGGLFGGTMLDIFEGHLLALERHGERVFLVKRPHRFTAKDDPAAARAVDLTFGSSVLEAAKIESIRDDGALVVDATAWFVSDLSGVSERVKRAVSTEPGKPGNASFDKERSYLESVKAFPDNVNIRAKLTFKPNDPPGISSVPDSRFLPVSIHYSLVRLPEDPMEPRAGDDRVGNFWTVHKDFSDEDSTFFVRHVNRWRLEPDGRDGDLWKPKEPIVYYIDRTVPEEYREAFKAGVEAWNDAFEAAGWKDAIRAEDLPEGADPEDIRYATLRWNVSDDPGYGAIGPSVVDPRTGEILDADILFEASLFLRFRRAWKDFVGNVTPAEAFESALSFGEAELASVAAGGELESFASAFAAQGALLAATLAARGEIGPGDPVPEEYMLDAVKWVTMHEVGHTLGLQHNFRSSASTPLGSLHDEAWAEENGVFSSVMEYPTANVAPPGQPNGPYYNPGVGSYDRWAIAYAYTPDAERAAELARQAADKRHLYGTNAEAGGPGALDPTINVYDLSDDPLAWGRQRTEIIRDLWGRLPEAVLADNARYHELSVALEALMSEYARAVAPAVKYLGGARINRDHVGDPDGRLPFEPLPLEEQREALAFVVDAVFAADALVLPPELHARLGSNRWLHWGSETTWDGRLDFPYHERVADFQRSALGQLLHPFRLSRIRDLETRYGASSVVGIPELMGELGEAVWSELAAGGSIPATRRDLQRAYLEEMTEILVDPPERMPADARSVARLELQALDGRIEGALQSGASLDAYTRAHLTEARARIEKALEAGLEAEKG